MRLGFSAVRGKERYSAGVFRQVRRGLRQAWELPRAGKGAALPCYLALRPDKDWAEVAAAILEGPSEMLAVTKLGLPPELRRLLAFTNIGENNMGTVQRVRGRVKYWRSPSMARRCSKHPRGSRRISSVHIARRRAVFTATAASTNADLGKPAKAA